MKLNCKQVYEPINEYTITLNSEEMDQFTNMIYKSAKRGDSYSRKLYFYFFPEGCSKHPFESWMLKE